MRELDQYTIKLNNLENKSYYYDFRVEDSFFSEFENSVILGGKIDVKLELKKSLDVLNLNFWLKGEAVLTCDRCLDKYSEAIDYKDNIFVKSAEITDFNTNNDFVDLARDSSEINISQFIFEFAIFALPFTHIHPNTKDGNITCNPEMIKILNKYIKTDNAIDPRWGKLKELKDKITDN